MINLVPVKRGHFWRAKLEKCKKKISKIFFVPNRPSGYTDQLYTYNGHIEYVGFTEKRQKTNKNSHFMLKYEILMTFWLEKNSVWV